MRLMLVVAALLAAGLAGCADDAGDDTPPDEAVDRSSFDLQAGTGAIAGLLVDDRFRPIQLTDDPTTEFQAEGFVLLQETGEQAQTTENGEFTFVDLDPGTYTLRVTAAGHEGTPQRVTVQEGVFNEVSLVARRVSSEGSSIVTQDFSVFVPCTFRTVENGRNVDCTFDQSGDTSRSAFYANYTEFGADATWLVTEMVPNQQGGYRVQVRVVDYPGYDGYYRYGTENNFDTEYIKIVNQYGVPNEEDNFYQDNQPWENDAEIQTILFPLGQFEREFTADWPLADVYDPCCGLGVRLGVQAKFIQSVFIGPPEVDPEAYCVLC